METVHSYELGGACLELYLMDMHMRHVQVKVQRPMHQHEQQQLLQAMGYREYMPRVYAPASCTQMAIPLASWDDRVMPCATMSPRKHSGSTMSQVELSSKPGLMKRPSVSQAEMRCGQLAGCNAVQRRSAVQTFSAVVV